MKIRKNRKELFLLISLAILVIVGIYATGSMGILPPTYGGNEDALALATDPESYDTDTADGVAQVMVRENQAKTVSPNVVFSVVFNYRGYDTMGESFVLFTTVCGTAAILRVIQKKKEEAGKR